MANKPILLAFEMKQIRTMADGSLTISLATPELPENKVGQLFGMRNKQGFAAFQVEEFTPEELKDMAEANLDLDLKKGKSSSERLRDVLFVLWKHEDPIGVDFNSFYSTKMETIIAHYKSKLPPREH